MTTFCLIGSWDRSCTRRIHPVDRAMARQLAHAVPCLKNESVEAFSVKTVYVTGTSDLPHAVAVFACSNRRQSSPGISRGFCSGTLVLSFQVIQQEQQVAATLNKRASDNPNLQTATTATTLAASAVGGNGGNILCAHATTKLASVYP
eukprot:487645-Prorocentrum_minimum.AAC.4